MHIFCDPLWPVKVPLFREVVSRFNCTFALYFQKLETEHLSKPEEIPSHSESTDEPSTSNVPALIREIVTKSISPPDLRDMSREASLANENRLLQDEMSRLEDLLATTRAERDEIGSKYSALSEKVSLPCLFVQRSRDLCLHRRLIDPWEAVLETI